SAPAIYIGKYTGGDFLSASNLLSITSGGSMSVDTMVLGGDGGDSSYGNTATVADPGSYLSVAGGSGSFGRNVAGMNNTLILSNGATGAGLSPAAIGISGWTNKMVVTGSNSMFGCMDDLVVGSGSSGNLLWIDNKAAVHSKNGWIGKDPGSEYNAAVVSGGARLGNDGNIEAGGVYA